jgi:hypothetical protein
MTHMTPSTELTLDRIARLAPSVFATERHASRSERYAYYPTGQIVEAMSAEGWAPVAATQAHARKDERGGHAKHMVRFARRDQLLDMSGMAVGERRIEAVLINSHDGSSAFKLHAGIYRKVCSNGLVVADGDFQCITVPHKGNQAAQVVEASMAIVRQLPELEGKVDELRALPLTIEHRLAFAEAAAIVRWGDLEAAPVAPERLLQARRVDDAGTDAWSTLNVVQENVIGGGLRGRTDEGRKIRTRPINGIDQNTLVNKALWHLMSKLAKG